ncbi:hypothetical protein DAC16_145 [Bacteroides phage DAC16]|nr:hypothetical protein DAC16_145 [Bacteroides phage DAC16]
MIGNNINIINYVFKF